MGTAAALILLGQAAVAGSLAGLAWHRGARMDGLPRPTPWARAWSVITGCLLSGAVAASVWPPDGLVEGLVAVGCVGVALTGLAAWYVRSLIYDADAAARARRQSESRYRALSAASPEAVALSDAAGVIVSGNDRAARMHGYAAPEDLAGMKLVDLLAPEHRDRASAHLRAALDSDAGVSAAFTFLRRDRTSFPGELTVAALRSGDTSPSGLLTMTRDLTAETAQARLISRLQESEQLENVGRLAGGVAHDFNNLLTLINGYSDLLLSALDETHPLREHAFEIAKAGGRAANLTRQLLTLSRQHIAQPRLMSLNDVVTEQEPVLRSAIREDIELRTALDRHTGSVVADPGQMAQVLMNLVVSARDALPNGGRVLVTTASVRWDARQTAQRPEIRPGRYVELAVHGTAAATDDRLIARTPAPCVPALDVQAVPGPGLATVDDIIRHSGGWMCAESNPGVGGTFRVYLAEVEESPELVAETYTAAAVLRGRETVLVVEDQPDVRHYQAMVLGRCGYSVLAAANGGEALKLDAATAGTIDLLITDVIMPGMTGRDLAARIQQRRPSVKVLYVSGYAADVIAREGVLDDRVPYLPKPFTPTQLAAKVRDVLN